MAGPTYPEDSIQDLVGDWWKQDDGNPPLCRGRLLWAFVPLIDQEPRTLTPQGRARSTDHGSALYRVDPLRMRQQRQGSRRPVAGLPDVPGEIYTVYRAKRRPVLVLGGGSTDPVERSLTVGMANWQTAPTVIVAPYYGATQSGTRGGFNQPFVARIRRAEYPEYMWDSLPVGGRDTEESILMLNQAQPIGRHYKSFEATEYRLCDDAIEVVEDWLNWLLTGELDPRSVLGTFREGVAALR